MSTTFPIDDNSLELLENITKGLDFSIPNVDFDDDAFKIPDALAAALQNVPDKLTIEMLTERKIDGAGCFDAIMKAMRVHLEEEFEAGRLTGAEYAKVYVATVQISLQQAVAYLLGKDQAYYQALATQAAALAANIDAYTAKVRLAIAQGQVLLTKAQYANEVIKLGMVDKQTDQIIAQTALVEEQYNTQVNQTAHVAEQTKLVTAQTATEAEKPAQIIAQTGLVTAQTATEAEKPAQVVAQTSLITAQEATEEKKPDQIVAQTTLIGKQTDQVVAQTKLVGEQYNTQVNQTTLVSKQINQVVAQTDLTEAQTECQIQQKYLLIEQTEQAHAQTSDTQMDDSTAVTGYIGNQNALLKQQVQAFKNDHILKGAKIFADSFATQLSMSTATVSGTGLDSSGINTAITTLQESIANSAT